MTKQLFESENDLCETEGAPHGTSFAGRRPVTAYPAIPVEEIAFALAVFVGAANGQFDRFQAPPSSAESDALAECQRIVWGDSACRQLPVDRSRKALSYEQTLESALLALWRRYGGDPRQASICLRVLSFYRLMAESAESAGSPVARWVQPCSAGEEEVLLHPALVQALACVPLGEQGRFTEDAFFGLVEDFAREQVCE